MTDQSSGPMLNALAAVRHLELSKKRGCWDVFESVSASGVSIALQPPYGKVCWSRRAVWPMPWLRSHREIYSRATILKQYQQGKLSQPHTTCELFRAVPGKHCVRIFFENARQRLTWILWDWLKPTLLATCSELSRHPDHSENNGNNFGPVEGDRRQRGGGGQFSPRHFWSETAPTPLGHRSRQDTPPFWGALEWPQRRLSNQNRPPANGASSEKTVGWKKGLQTFERVLYFLCWACADSVWQRVFLLEVHSNLSAETCWISNIITHSWEKLNRGVSKPGCFPLFSGKVQIVSRTLSGLFLVGALNRPRKRKRTNRENSRSIPEQIGKIPEKSGKSQKGQEGQKRKDKSRSGNPPVWRALTFRAPQPCW